MDLNYGINGFIAEDAARPIVTESSTPIAIISDCSVGDIGIQSFQSADSALEVLGNTACGSLKQALDMISLQGVNCPIIVGLVRTAEDMKANIIDTIDTMTRAEALTGFRPDLIISPNHSFDVDIAARLDAAAAKLLGTAIVDNLAADETAAKAWAENFSSRNLLIYGPCAKYYDTKSAANVGVGASAAIAAMIARTDGEVRYGFADSISNRVVKGITGTQRNAGPLPVDAILAEQIIEYADGQDCEARRLRQAGIGSIVADEGWRTYGFETTDIDPIWQALERVRTFTKALRAIQKASKWARDRRANELLEVRKSVDAFMRELKGNNVALGFDIFFDPLKNTNATVTAGIFYLTVKWQNMSLIRELNIEMVYTDDYGSVLLNMINGGN